MQMGFFCYRHDIQNIYIYLQDPYTSQLPSKYTPVKYNESYIHTLIKKGKFAIFGKIIDSIFFPEDDIFNEELKVRCKNVYLKY